MDPQFSAFFLFCLRKAAPPHSLQQITLFVGFCCCQDAAKNPYPGFEGPQFPRKRGSSASKKLTFTQRRIHGLRRQRSFWREAPKVVKKDCWSWLSWLPKIPGCVFSKSPGDTSEKVEGVPSQAPGVHSTCQVVLLLVELGRSKVVSHQAVEWDSLLLFSCAS